jgi:signal transduction histidine kinase/FixJ family two-component response regulator
VRRGRIRHRRPHTARKCAGFDRHVRPAGVERSVLLHGRPMLHRLKLFAKRWLLPAGLRGRVVLLLAVAIVPALGMLAFAHLDRNRRDTQQLRQSALTLARLAADAQERRIEGARQLLIALSHVSELDRDPADCTQFVRDLTREYQGLYTEIGWADKTGRVVCHALPGPPDISIADRSYFQQVMATNAFRVGDLMVGRLSAKPTLAFAYPKRDATNVVIGVIFANVDLRLLSASLSGDVHGSDATVSIVDRNGVIVARSEGADRLIGSKASNLQLAVMRSRGPIVRDFRGPDGVPRVFGIVALRDHASEPIMFVSVGLAREPLLASATRQLRFDLMVVGILGAGLLTVGWVMSDRLIRRPIRRLVDATSALAGGNLEARAPSVGGASELTVLGHAFNDMAGRLQQRDLHLRHGQRMEAVGQLAGGIAHDFNNLLTVIIGYAESIGEQLIPGTAAVSELTELQTAAERAAKLTQQLLAFSRRQVLQPRPVHLTEIVAHAQKLLTRTIGDHIRLVTLNAAPSGVVRADPGQLEQVLLNLAINARDAMPDGGTITIETMNVVRDAAAPPIVNDDVAIPPGNYVSLRVSDTGTGMNAATRARVFEPFFTTKGLQGTGLGLATVYGIVKQSGGFIACASEPGRGTTFTIYLPETDDQIECRSDRRAATPPGGTERILVVEDEDAVRSLVVKVLSSAGYDVVDIDDGPEAAAWIRSAEPVDLLVTDVQMPGMNGQMLSDLARQANRDLPVLFMSGYANDILRQGTRAESAFIQKPFTPHDVLRTVRQCLDNRPISKRDSASGHEPSAPAATLAP